MARSTASPCWRSTSRSSPKILIAICALTPETSSSTRSWIGCEKLYDMPGMLSSRARIFSTSPSCERAVFHSERGRRFAMTSLTSRPIGSEAISARPVLDTTVVISGNDRSTRSTSSSICRDDDSETLGSRNVCIPMAPSSSGGRNSRPSRVNNSPLSTSPASASTTGTCQRMRHQRSAGR